MARQVRIEYPGAIYHVMARGDRREEIFRDKEDREMFCEALREVREKYGVFLHGYVLMSNHYHLLMETPEPNLVGAMKWFQNTYTRRFNVKHGLWGHLFGGRYKAILVDDKDPQYFSRLLDYVHLNPARIGWGSQDLKWWDYPYSSLRDYVSTQRPEWLEVNRGFRYLDLDDKASGRRAFLKRLEDRVKEEGGRKAGIGFPGEQGLQSTVQRGWQFGSDAFRQRMLAKAGKTLEKMRAKGQDGYRGLQMRDHGKQRAEALIRKAESLFKIEKKAWTEMGKTDWRKCLLASVIQEQSGMTLGWICEKLTMGDRSYACRNIAKEKGNLKDRERQSIRNELSKISINND